MHISDACLKTIGEVRRWATYQGGRIQNSYSEDIAKPDQLSLSIQNIYVGKKNISRDMFLQFASLLYRLSISISIMTSIAPVYLNNIESQWHCGLKSVFSG